MLAVVERQVSAFGPRAPDLGREAAEIYAEAVFRSQGNGPIQRPQRHIGDAAREILAAIGVRLVILGSRPATSAARSEQTRDYYDATIRQRLGKRLGCVTEFLVAERFDTIAQQRRS